MRAYTLLVVFAACFAQAQVPTAVKANWKLADKFTSDAMRPFTYGTSVTPGWINKSDAFWYSWRASDGVHFWKVDGKTRKKEPLFDSATMAELLSAAMKKPYDTTNLPVTTVTFDKKNDDLIRFNVENQVRFEYDLKKKTLKEIARGQAEIAKAERKENGGDDDGDGGQRGRFGGFRGFGGNRDFHNYSPDKKAFVYAMDDNLYYAEVKDGKDQPPIQLTKDGEKYYSFGSKREEDEQRQQMQEFQRQFQQQGGGDQGDQKVDEKEKRVRARVTWSKDSKRFFAERTDERKVADLYLVNSLSEPRPTLSTYRYAMPGEINVPQEEFWVFEPETKTLKKVKADKWKDQLYMNIHFQDNDSDHLRFVRRDRLQRNLEFCEDDLKTDKITPLLSESVENAFLEIQPVRYLKTGGDFLWWSERDGWGHYYLYSNDGKLKYEIAPGPYRAESIVDVDADKGLLWFTGVGREAGENPYYSHLYRVKLDGKSEPVLLDAGDEDHRSTLSDDHKFIVDVCSRTDKEPCAWLRDENGKVIMQLEHTDLSALEAMGWKMPETFQVKAADGVTNIYGNMWKPFDFDPHKKYPIIANVYPGPQTESVSSTWSAYSTNQRLAQLGFIVIQIGNRGGNPERSNAYHSYGYYNLRDYGLADKKAGIEQLADRFPWIDIERVGIYGHSGGGFMTAAALMLPPYNDFFKVGVSSSGNHDNNVYNQNWSEQHHGLREVKPPVKKDEKAPPPPFEEDPSDPTYVGAPELLLGWPDEDPQGRRGGGQRQGQTGGEQQTNKNQGQFQIHVPTNAELAANLKGSLLLAHGDMDNNVHYAGTVRLMNALMRAKKRFEFILIPGKPHGYGDLQPYFNQRLMEYFAEHLLGDYERNSADMKITP